MEVEDRTRAIPLPTHASNKNGNESESKAKAKPAWISEQIEENGMEERIWFAGWNWRNMTGWS